MDEKFVLRHETIDLIRRVFVGFPEVEEVIIFGSRAMGTHKPGSDIDLALKGKNLDYKLIETIRSLLQDGLYTLYFYDVLNYDNIQNPAVKDSIDKYGKPLFG